MAKPTFAQAFANHPNRLLSMLISGRNSDETVLSGDEGALLASAVRAAAPDIATQLNPGATGLQLILDVTAVPGTPSMTLSIDCVPFTDQAKRRTLTAFPAVVAVGVYVYQMGRGLVETAAVAGLEVMSIAVPARYDVTLTQSAGNWTYSLDYAYLF